jgi:hypothetical protein
MKRRRRPIPQSGIKAFTRSREPEGSKGRTVLELVEAKVQLRNAHQVLEPASSGKGRTRTR